MDLIIRNARLSTRPADGLLDIGVENGRIAAIAPALAADGRKHDAKGGLVCAGLIETHIHLDKSRIIARCPPEETREISPVKTGDRRNPQSAVRVQTRVADDAPPPARAPAASLMGRAKSLFEVRGILQTFRWRFCPRCPNCEIGPRGQRRTDCHPNFRGGSAAFAHPTSTSAARTPSRESASGSRT
jgi:hypothetical protein